MKKLGMFLMVLSLCWFTIGCGEGTTPTDDTTGTPGTVDDTTNGTADETDDTTNSDL